jgi:hypothetical protein
MPPFTMDTTRLLYFEQIGNVFFITVSDSNTDQTVIYSLNLLPRSPWDANRIISTCVRMLPMQAQCCEYLELVASSFEDVFANTLIDRDN